MSIAHRWRLMINEDKHVHSEGFWVEGKPDMGFNEIYSYTVYRPPIL